jgi:hypothetical protein
MIQKDDRFGRLVILGPAGRDVRRTMHWQVRCACGTELTVAQGQLLRKGMRGTRSCGCLRREVAALRHTTHGQHANPLHGVWQAMIQRCTNKKDKLYKYYGGRGVTVDSRWRGERGFENFLADMGPKPTPAHTLERKKNNEGYSKENCKWATRGEQMRNTSRTRFFTIGAETLCVTDWALRRGLPVKRVQWRLKNGWTIEEALQ